jgi:hypothetical protein
MLVETRDAGGRWSTVKVFWALGMPCRLELNLSKLSADVKLGGGDV